MSGGRKEKAITGAGGITQGQPPGLRQIQCKRMEDGMKRNVMSESRGGRPPRPEGIKQGHREGEEQNQANLEEIYDLERDGQSQIRKNERGKGRIIGETFSAKVEIRDKKIEGQEEEGDTGPPASEIGQGSRARDYNVSRAR